MRLVNVDRDLLLIPHVAIHMDRSANDGKKFSKSSKNYTKASYDSFKKRFGKKVGEGLIVHPKQLQRDPNGYRIPSYMMFCALE